MKNRTAQNVSMSVLLFCMTGVLFAEKELMYDPVKGIIFVEKGTVPSSSKPAGAPVRKEPATDLKSTPRHKKKKKPSTAGSDLHIGRKKDPPELYFKSGLEYYKNSDFENALKNFSFADSMKHRPEYLLWIGKTQRSLGRIDDMLKTMFTIIKNEPDCDVADDALFELAIYYKSIDDYDKATALFSQLIEQYPFGLAFSTGEELREIAREQRRLMRAEMVNILTTLGFIDEDLQTSYRNFQEANKLPVTEVGDLQTVKAVKEQHRRYLEQEELKITTRQQFDRYSIWLYSAIAAGTINILLLLLLFSKIKTRKLHIIELQKIITELDTRKL